VAGAVLVEVEDQTQLQKVMRTVRRVKGVTGIARQDAGPQGDAPLG
jgi:hypothetical protein